LHHANSIPNSEGAFKRRKLQGGLWIDSRANRSQAITLLMAAVFMPDQ